MLVHWLILNFRRFISIFRIDKRFYRPGEPVRRWAIVVFETQQRFPPQAVQDCMKGLIGGCRDVGK